MCIIQGDEDYHVADTQIFVAPVKGERQLTVYSNQVMTEAEMAQESSGIGSFFGKLFNSFSSEETKANPDALTKAMILPVVSYERGADVRLIDLSKFAEMFDEFRKFFAPKRTWGDVELNSRKMAECENEPLPVVRVGSYDVSIVPTKEDFGLLRKDVFQLDPEVGKLFGGKSTVAHL